MIVPSPPFGVKLESRSYTVGHSLKRKYMPVIFDRLLCIPSMGVLARFRLNGFAVVDEKSGIQRIHAAVEPMQKRRIMHIII